MASKSKVQTEVLYEFRFADDMAKGAPTEEKMQKGVDHISDSCDSYDLTISIKKTKVIYQPASGKPYMEPIITVFVCVEVLRPSQNGVMSSMVSLPNYTFTGQA